MTLQDYEFFSHLLRERSGISIGREKHYLIDARMRPVVAEANLEDLEALVAQLRARRNPVLERRVVEEMTTNETSFFRDVRPFDMLASDVLPRLIEVRASRRKLQIWCAACSSGQEPYSIGIVLRESFPELADWTIGILATDLSDEVLEQARAGSYNQLEVNRGLPAPLLEKYFERQGIRWRIADEIRDMVEFRKLNLLDSFDRLPPPDIVFLRNVLIYFEPECKRQILARVYDLMGKESVLFLGTAETADECFEAVEAVEVTDSRCYRKKRS